MALIAVASAKGSPGVSTAALAMAAVWPRASLLAELDPSGGDLVFRLQCEDGSRLDPNRGMLSLALAARRGLTPNQMWEHTQRLAGGQQVLAGLPSADQAAAWTGQWATLGRALAGIEGGDVIADVGRLGPGSPALDVLPHASLVLLLARTQPEDVARVRDRAVALASQVPASGRSGPPVGVVLVCEQRQQTKAMADMTQVLAAADGVAEVAGVIAYDPAGAEQLAGRRRGRVHKTALVGTARNLVAGLGGRFGLGYGPQPAEAKQEVAH